jgi:formamidopyrimidine-DNA glycosylase
MPELPEVETVRLGLERRMVGRRFHDVEVTGLRTVRRTSVSALQTYLEGATVQAVDRRGKYLIVHLDGGIRVMIHLRMSGQVLIAEHTAVRPPHTHVAARLSPQSSGVPHEEFRFVDPRTFGEVVAFQAVDEVEQVPELARLGWDPLAEPHAMDRRRWRDLLTGRRRQLKAVLLDQHVIAGIGNIYSDEILHRARLRPDRRSDELSAAQATRLLEAVVDILHAAVAAGGSSLRDAQYVDIDGQLGGYQHEHRVVGRAPGWCMTCHRSRIRRVVSAGRSTSYCPWCQR